MRIIAVVALVLLVAPAAPAQMGQGTDWEFRLAGGVMVRFMAWVEGPRDGVDAQELFGSTTVNDGKAIHRLFRDSADRPFFGYDLVIEKLDSRRMRANVRPLSTAPGTPFFPKAPEPKIIDDGDIVDLEVMVHPSNGGRITDRFSASLGGRPIGVLPSPSQPRDLTLESLSLLFADLRVLRNGEEIHQSPATRMTCKFLEVYVPGTGAIVLGLLPQAGYPFRKEAVIDNKVVRFKLGNDSYELKSSQPILQEGGHWYIWLYHDPAFRPQGAGDEVDVTAMGNLSNLR